MPRNKKRKKRDKKKLPESLNKLAWQMARAMTKLERPPDSKKWLHQKVYCPICKRAYCLNASFQDAYCADCYINKNKKAIEDSDGIFAGCQKPIVAKKSCQLCGG